MFKEVCSIEDRGEIVHIGDAALAFEPDVELSESAKLCITKTWGSKRARNSALFVGVHNGVYQGYAILFKFL